MNVAHVRQEQPFGCGIAVLAMLTGKRYSDVAADFDSARLEEQKGLLPREIERYLFDHGYALRTFYRRLPPLTWPLQPFAPTHFAMVEQRESGRGHFVVMDSMGRVLDPLCEGDRHLTRDFAQVVFISGVYFVGEVTA